PVFFDNCGPVRSLEFLLRGCRGAAVVNENFGLKEITQLPIPRRHSSPLPERDDWLGEPAPLGGRVSHRLEDLGLVSELNEISDPTRSDIEQGYELPDELRHFSLSDA